MYEKQTWVNGQTPLSAGRLNHMEEGIENTQERFAFVDVQGPTAFITLADTTNFTVTPNASVINITIPATIEEGFAAEVNFKSGSTPPTINVTNNTELDFRVVIQGSTETSYLPAANANCDMMFYHNGLMIECAILEIELGD